MNLDYPLVVCVHVSCLRFFLLKMLWKLQSMFVVIYNFTCVEQISTIILTNPMCVKKNFPYKEKQLSPAVTVAE